MYKISEYTELDSMSDLINDNYSILLPISRFGISLGFGDKTIGEVCKENKIDTKTFLVIVNMIINEDSQIVVDSTLSIKTILAYLHNSHKYFLSFKLPKIREMLLNSIGINQTNVAIVIMKFYDEYVEHVVDKKCRAGVCKSLTTLYITDKCIGCTKCVRNCPVNCITGELRKLHRIDTTKCIKCDACIQNCPVSPEGGFCLIFCPQNFCLLCRLELHQLCKA